MIRLHAKIPNMVNSCYTQNLPDSKFGRPMNEFLLYDCRSLLKPSSCKIVAVKLLMQFTVLGYDCLFYLKHLNELKAKQRSIGENRVLYTVLYVLRKH